MKNIELMIDINVVLDYLEDREPFSEDAEKLINSCDRRHIKGFLSASSITTLYYLLHKFYHDKEKTYDILDKLLSKLDVLPILGHDILDSLELRPKDFEDAVIASSCKWGKMDAIVTRNKNGFKNFGIKLYTPDEALKVIESYK